MLTDFGIARINSDGDDVCEEGMGSLRWMAPELLMPEGGSFACHTTATDVWAFGMTMFEVRSTSFALPCADRHCRC